MTFLHSVNVLVNINAHRISKKNGFLAIAAGAILFSSSICAQSPYSRFGFGGYLKPQSIGQTSTSSLGIGFRSTTMLNLNNPAALSELEWTTFEAGARIDNYRINLGDQTFSSPTGRVSNLAIAVPIRVKNKKRWGSSFSLSPSGVVQYAFNEEIDSLGIEHTKYERGSGSSYAVNWSNGWLWNATSIGLSCIYSFGTESNFQGIIVDDSLNARNSRKTSRLNHQSLQFNLGWQYTIPLGAAKLDRIQPKLTLGASLAATAKANRNITRQDELTLTSVLTGQEVAIDTLSVEEVSAGILPRGMDHVGLGLSVGDHRAWLIHADYRYSLYNEYFHWLPGPENYRNTHYAALGFRGTPNYSSRNFFARIEYRLGGHWEQSPLIIDDIALNTFGMAFGVGLPMGKSMSRLNLSVAFERRSGGGNLLSQEDWVSLVIGVNLNDKWFVKRKFN